CITASQNVNGALLVVQPCSPAAPPNQEWQVSFFTEENGPATPMVVLGDKCIDVTDGLNSNGVPLQVWTCAEGNTNQLWISITDSSFQWAGTDKCIDLTGGATANGTILQIWTCESTNLASLCPAPANSTAESRR
ncbi:ricin B lectin domain-containing protein, partial [Mycena galopus ATCC 62051]